LAFSEYVSTSRTHIDELYSTVAPRSQGAEPQDPDPYHARSRHRLCASRIDRAELAGVRSSSNGGESTTRHLRRSRFLSRGAMHALQPMRGSDCERQRAFLLALRMSIVSFRSIWI